jgi:hypothetical protein
VLPEAWFSKENVYAEKLAFQWALCIDKETINFLANLIGAFKIGEVPTLSTRTGGLQGWPEQCDLHIPMGQNPVLHEG